MEKVVNLSLKSLAFIYHDEKQSSDFKAKIGADSKQPGKRLKMGVAYKKTCSFLTLCFLGSPISYKFSPIRL